MIWSLLNIYKAATVLNVRISFLTAAVSLFKTILNEQPDVSPAIAALTVLLDFLEKDTCKFYPPVFVWSYNVF